jgi:hypothetical protein
MKMGTCLLRFWDNTNSMMLSTEEINRAIYLDFESKGKRRDGTQPPPALGGTLIETVYKPTLLDPALQHAATFRSYGHSSLKNYLTEIYEQATNETRRIIFFSSTEFNIFKNHSLDISEIGFDLRGPAKQSRLYINVWKEFKTNAQRFRNRNTARTTRKTLRPKAHGLLSLIADDLGMQRPVVYGAGLCGDRITNFMNQAEKKPDYESWSSSGKRNLTQLVKHNKHDCECTKYVLEHLAQNI